MTYAEIIEKILEEKRRGGDDFDVIEAVSLALEIPRIRVKSILIDIQTSEAA